MAEEKLILTVDLYDNALTEAPGDYVGRVRITGTVYNRDIAARVVAQRTEYRPETIENILNIADQEKALALAQGRSVIDGVGQLMAQAKGSFDGEKAPFNPAKHSLTVSYTMGRVLREILKKVEVQTYPASTGPIINSVLDSFTGKTNEVLTPAQPLVLNGSNIRVLGDSAEIGVYFTPSPSGEPVKSPLIVHNNPSQLTVMIPPALSDGQYTVSVCTQTSSNSQMVKKPRTYTYPVILTVGSGEGGDDIL